MSRGICKPIIISLTCTYSFSLFVFSETSLAQMPLEEYTRLMVVDIVLDSVFQRVPEPRHLWNGGSRQGMMIGDIMCLRMQLATSQ